MKLAFYITAAVIVLVVTSCSGLPPIAVGVKYTSPNTGIDYTVNRNSDGSYYVEAQK